LLLRRTERRHITGFFDFVDPGLEVDAPLREGVEIGRRPAATLMTRMGIEAI